MISRRKFLQGTSSIALLAGTPACGGINNPGSGAAAPSGPTGRALINDGSSSQSFIWANILKCAHAIGPRTNATYAWQAFLDSNGYPNNAPGNQLSDDIQYLFAIPPAWGTAPLVVSWKGTGAFYMQPAAVSNYSVTAGTGVVDTSTLPTLIKVTGTNVRIVFNFTTAPVAGEDAYIGYFLGATTYSGFNSLVFCRQSDEIAVNANQNALNPDYVAMQRALNPRTFRGLDISGVNNGNQSQFSQRAPAGAFSFFAERYPPECWAGTIGGTNTYSCSTPPGWGGLVEGATIIGQFTNPNTLTGASVTLNVGGTGAKQMSADVFPNAINSAGVVTAGAVWTFNYSVVYDQWVGRKASSGPLPAAQGGIIVRAPIEQHIAIANAVNCNLWYPICHRMTPADGTALTAVVLANLNSQLAFYPEFSNEVWNLGGNAQSTFIGNAGFLMGLGAFNGGGFMSGYGLLARRMMGAITTAWGGPNSRLRRVMAFQAYGDSGLGGQNNVQRFKGANLAPNGTGSGGLGLGNATYNTFTGSADYTTSPNRPIDFSDVMSYATYYSGGQLQQFDGNYSTPIFGATKNITGITKDATGGVLSYASDPGYSTGQRLNIAGVVGMTQINGANVSLSKLTATTYKMFTDATLGTGFDTSGFTAYSSGGTSALYPIISGLTAWADLYATLTAPNITSAFNSLDTDIRSGSQYNSSGSLSQNGTQTLLDLSTNIYPAWETIAASYDGARPAGTVNLTIECYEGAMGGNVPSAAACTVLGISTAYATAIGNLMFAYKNDARFSTLVQNQYAQFMASGAHAKTPAQYQIVGIGGPWCLTPGDLYTIPPAGSGQYKSWDANVTFNH